LNQLREHFVDISSVAPEADKLKVERDTGELSVTLETGFPVLLTATKELNEPRLPNMMQILAAANKPIQTLGAGELGVSADDLANRLTTGTVKGFSMDRKKIMIDGEPPEQADKLIEYIRGTIGR